MAHHRGRLSTFPGSAPGAPRSSEDGTRTGQPGAVPCPGANRLTPAPAAPGAPFRDSLRGMGTRPPGGRGALRETISAVSASMEVAAFRCMLPPPRRASWGAGGASSVSGATLTNGPRLRPGRSEPGQSEPALCVDHHRHRVGQPASPRTNSDGFAAGLTGALAGASFTSDGDDVGEAFTTVEG